MNVHMSYVCTATCARPVENLPKGTRQYRERYTSISTSLAQLASSVQTRYLIIKKYCISFEIQDDDTPQYSILLCQLFRQNDNQISILLNLWYINTYSWASYGYFYIWVRFPVHRCSQDYLQEPEFQAFLSLA